MTYKSKTVPVKISSGDLLDILCAIRCVVTSLDSEGYSARKWEILYDNLKEQLGAFDEKNGCKEWRQ